MNRSKVKKPTKNESTEITKNEKVNKNQGIKKYKLKNERNKSTNLKIY